MNRYPFTYYQEVGYQGQSLTPHFPGGNSGVTIGPGYDLSHRSPQEIFIDLSTVGIDYEVIAKLIEAAQKSGNEASAWVAEHGGIVITEEQQQALYEQVLVPVYEERAQQQLQNFQELHGLIDKEIQWNILSVRQREALFDFVYNTGGLTSFPEFTLAVLRDDWESVSSHYERFSGDMPLVYRNEMFYQKFIQNQSDFFNVYEDHSNEVIISSLESYENMNNNINSMYNTLDEDSENSNMDDWYDNYY